MDKKTGIIIVICLICFISIRVYIAMNVPSSSGTVNEQTYTDFPLGLPAVFTGTLPCASCPGVETHLLVDSTGFREVTRYIGENSGFNATYGTWEISGSDSLILSSEGQVLKKYFIANDTLNHLDLNDNRVEGDLSENYLLTYSDMENQIRSRHEELRQSGFEFIAAGNEPFWSVRVSDKDYVIYETPEMRKSGELEQRRFDTLSPQLNARFGSGESLELTIRDEFCQDSMSGFLFTHTVTLQYENREERGCGRFLNEVWSSN